MVILHRRLVRQKNPSGPLLLWWHHVWVCWGTLLAPKVLILSCLFTLYNVLYLALIIPTVSILGLLQLFVLLASTLSIHGFIDLCSIYFPLYFDVRTFWFSSRAVNKLAWWCSFWIYIDDFGIENRPNCGFVTFVKSARLPCVLLIVGLPGIRVILFTC